MNFSRPGSVLLWGLAVAGMLLRKARPLNAPPAKSHAAGRQPSLPRSPRSAPTWGNLLCPWNPSCKDFNLSRRQPGGRVHFLWQMLSTGYFPAERQASGCMSSCTGDARYSPISFWLLHASVSRGNTPPSRLPPTHTGSANPISQNPRPGGSVRYRHRGAAKGNGE